MSTRVSKSIAGSRISPYFGVDTHRYTLELQFRYQYIECACPQQHNACLYVAPFLRYSRLPQNSPEILSLLSWTAFTGTNGRKQLYLTPRYRPGDPGRYIISLIPRCLGTRL